MSTRNMDAADPSRLAGLLQMSESNEPVWSQAELGAIFKHQLSAPVEYDLGRLQRGNARKLKVTADAQGLLLKSFGDLLHHPNPPLELLKLTKEFAKHNRMQPDSAFPVEISTILYFASIAAAMLRCRQRITKLDDAALAEGFTWSRDQAWVDQPTRALFDEALQLLSH